MALFVYGSTLRCFYVSMALYGPMSLQLESVAEISNFQCIHIFHYIETPMIDMFQNIETPAY